MPRVFEEITYTFHHQDGSRLLRSYQQAGDLIYSISFPKNLRPGDEFLPTRPTVVLKRNLSKLKEFFTWPFGFITKKIRIEFFWNGIEIVGSNMEKPNVLVLPFPDKTGEEANWYLKTICKGDCPPGMKPIYISIDTLHENQINKYILKFFKLISLCFLLAILIAIPLALKYKGVQTMDPFIQLIQKTTPLPSVTTLSPIAFLFLLLIIFWDKIDSLFESFIKPRTPSLLINLNANGMKALGIHAVGGRKILGEGINVKENLPNQEIA
jgi:hypothetical protein